MIILMMIKIDTNPSQDNIKGRWYPIVITWNQIQGPYPVTYTDSKAFHQPHKILKWDLLEAELTS